MKKFLKIFDHALPAIFWFSFLFLILGQVAGEFIRAYGEYYLHFPSWSGEASYIIITVLIAIGFQRMFKVPGSGMFTKKNLGKGLLYLLPFIIWMVISNTIPGIKRGLVPDFSIAALWTAAITAMAPGICEELLFRGISVYNCIRVKNEENRLIIYLILSSLAFSISHSLNLLAGVSFGNAVSQLIYTMGCGMFLGAVYLKFRTIWPCIIAHTIWDFSGYIWGKAVTSAQMAEKSVETGASLASGIIAELVPCIILIAAALYIIRPSARKEICQLWEETI